MVAARDREPAAGGRARSEASHPRYARRDGLGRPSQAGRNGDPFVRAQGGVAEASVLTTDIRTSAVNAALANGMFAHADETDDFEPVTKAHPGCAVVPAALAMAEREGSVGSGAAARRGARLRPVLPLPAWRSGRTTCAPRTAAPKASSSTFGAVGGRGVAGAARRDGHALRAVLRGAAGVRHLELGARHRARRKGVRLRRHGRPQRRHRGADGAGGLHRRRRRARRRAQRARGAVDASRSPRRWSPASAAASSSPKRRSRCSPSAIRFRRRSMRSSRCAGSTVSRADNVERIVVRLPADGAGIVDNRAMPDVNCQYIIAVALHRRHAVVRGQPLLRADERPAGPGREGARAARRRSRADGSRRAAQRPGGGDAAGRAHGEPLHAPRAGDQGEPARHGARERQGARPDGAGARAQSGPRRSFGA